MLTGGPEVQSFTVDGCPREHECDLYVEHDENQSNHVEPQVKLHEAGSNGWFSAFVDFLFFRTGIGWAQKPTNEQIEQHKDKSDRSKQGQIADDGCRC